MPVFFSENSVYDVKRRFVRLLARILGSTDILKPRAVPHTSKPDLQLGLLLQNADSLRDAGIAVHAAVAYREALVLAPSRSDVRVQLGNMLKDSGQFTAAETAYREALALSNQADTHLQLGHLYKAMGRRSQALTEYQCAIDLDPGTGDAVQELAEAGDRQQQERRFETEVRGGGVEALLTLSYAIASMRTELDRLSRLLPEAQARTAFPIALYDTFRAVFPVPAASVAPNLTFHVVLLAEREGVTTLFAQINAVQAQSFRSWTLSVLGHSPERQRVAELAAISDTRIRWIDTNAESNLAGSEQKHAGAIAEDWVLLLAAGAMLDVQALGWFAAAAAWSGAAAFVTDEETGTLQRGRVIRSSPVLRQVVDFDTLLEANVFGETIAVRSDAYRTTLPSLPDVSVAASRTALLLALSSTGQVGHVPYPLVWRSAPGPVVAADHLEGVAAHLDWAGLACKVTQEAGAAPAWQPRQPYKPIAVIIPTRDNAADLLAMVRSLRETAGAPGTLDIILVDNGSSQAVDLCLLQGMAAENGIRVLRRDEPFNWSNLNNEAAKQTEASLLLFANDDMRMITAGWDMRLRGLLEREDVGAVGARLLYDDDTVQHAGVIFGWKGSVIHDGLFEAADASGPACRWQVTRAVGAVTGAFLATRRDCFLELGGFDAVALPVAYSDIDYALKLRATGLKVLWTPAITLYHHESKTRSLDHTDAWRTARNAHERAVMEARWGTTMDQDPSIHPFWFAATLPFRLLTSPSLRRIREHIIQTGSRAPWMISDSKVKPI